MPSFSVKITAHDASTTDPKLQAHDLTTKNQHLPFPVIDESDVSLHFKVTDGSEHIAKSIDDVRFPQVLNRASGLSAESFAKNNGKQIQLDQLPDSSTWKIQDDNAALNDQVYTVTKLGNAFPDFNWYEHVTVDPADKPYIDVGDIDYIKRDTLFYFFDDNQTEGATVNPFLLDRVQLVDAPEDDKINDTWTCAIVDSKGNHLDGDCSQVLVTSGYVPHVKNLNPLQKGRQIQLYLQDKDQLIEPTAAFPNGKGLEIPDTVTPKSKPKLIGYVTNYGVYGNNSCVGGVGGQGMPFLTPHTLFHVKMLSLPLEHLFIKQQVTRLVAKLTMVANKLSRFKTRIWQIRSNN